MRRHKLLLVAGVTAYFIGSLVNFYLWRPEACSCGDWRCRTTIITEYPRAVLLHPIKAIEYLFAPVCND